MAASFDEVDGLLIIEADAPIPPSAAVPIRTDALSPSPGPAPPPPGASPPSPSKSPPSVPDARDEEAPAASEGADASPPVPPDLTEPPKVGALIQSLDVRGIWCDATVLKVRAGDDALEVLVHYPGWHKKWDEWVPVVPGRLRGRFPKAQKRPRDAGGRAQPGSKRGRGGGRAGKAGRAPPPVRSQVLPPPSDFTSDAATRAGEQHPLGPDAIIGID